MDLIHELNYHSFIQSTIELSDFIFTGLTKYILIETCNTGHETRNAEHGTNQPIN